MSDMNFELAKRVVDAEFHPTSGFSKDDPTLIAAKAFIAGHASRDPEVAELKAEVEQLRGALGEWKADFAYVKTELSAEREAARKLVEAAGNLCKHFRIVYGDNTNFGLPPISTGNHLLTKLEQALKFYATPKADQ